MREDLVRLRKLRIRVDHQPSGHQLLGTPCENEVDPIPDAAAQAGSRTIPDRLVCKLVFTNATRDGDPARHDPEGHQAGTHLHLLVK
jgi:hypothetical protein